MLRMGSFFKKTQKFLELFEPNTVLWAFHTMQPSSFILSIADRTAHFIFWLVVRKYRPISVWASSFYALAVKPTNSVLNDVREEASTHKSAKTHAGNVFVPRDLGPQASEPISVVRPIKLEAMICVFRNFVLNMLCAIFASPAGL